jgi:hypothetical protein
MMTLAVTEDGAAYLLLTDAEIRETVRIAFEDICAMAINEFSFVGIYFPRLRSGDDRCSCEDYILARLRLPWIALPSEQQATYPIPIYGGRLRPRVL